MDGRILSSSSKCNWAHLTNSQFWYRKFRAKLKNCTWPSSYTFLPAHFTLRRISESKGKESSDCIGALGSSPFRCCCYMSVNVIAEVHLWHSLYCDIWSSHKLSLSCSLSLSFATHRVKSHTISSKVAESSDQNSYYSTDCLCWLLWPCRYLFLPALLLHSDRHTVYPLHPSNFNTLARYLTNSER